MKEEFMQAVTRGDLDKVKELLGIDPSLAAAADGNGVSAILKAAYYRKSDVLAVLLDQGVELSLFEASATGQTDRVRAILAKEPDRVNSFAADGFPPLSLAVFFGRKETVEALLAAGAEVNTVTRESMKVTPLHSAAAARQVDIARLLISHGAEVNARQADLNFTPLHEAAANGDSEFVRLLLANGADVNVKTTDGKTPLKLALDRKQDETAGLLQQNGAIE